MRDIAHNQHVGFELDSFPKWCVFEHSPIIGIGIDSVYVVNDSTVVIHGIIVLDVVCDQTHLGTGIPVFDGVSQSSSTVSVCTLIIVNGHNHVALLIDWTQQCLLNVVCPWHENLCHSMTWP